MAIFAIIVSCKNNKDTVEVESTEPTISTEDQAIFEKATTFFSALPQVAENPENPITDEKVKLGKILYFDKNLSKKGNISCNSCHNLSTYGVDNLPVSPGDAGENGARNSPTVFNAALHISQFWDGRAKDVEEQAGGPVLNPIEMAMPDESFVVDKISKVRIYKDLFAKAFPDDENPITYANITKAIAAFERTLIFQDRFDQYLAGDQNALTQEEKTGLKNFIDAGCITCHIGNNLGGNMYQKFGLINNYWEYTKSENIDEGKFTVTNEEADKYIFKVSGLRNIEKTYPYFHDGSIADLGESVKIMAKVQLNKDLDEEQVASIVTFLKTLTAEIPEDVSIEPEELKEM